MNWNDDMSAAPRDGTPVLLRGPRGGKVRARFTFNAWGVRDWHIIEKGEMFMIGATHWMPTTRDKGAKE